MLGGLGFIVEGCLGFKVAGLGMFGVSRVYP